MNCLICCDKFKGSITAIQACQAIRRGLSQKYKDLHYNTLPIADGGDGSLDVIKQYIEGDTIAIDTIDALGRAIQAPYFKSGDNAFIELAAASGIARLQPQELAPLSTHTRGTGTLIREALHQGCQKIVLMLGGSCSTDLGLGIAVAMGYQLLDESAHPVLPGGSSLSDIKTIITPDDLPKFTLNVLCDVDNLLYGRHGAAYVYAPQKGATAEQVQSLDHGLRHVSQIIQTQYGIDISTIKGGGSAGGVAAGLYGLLGARVQNGFDYMSDLISLEDQIKKADIVVTGEGQLDEQSLSGKVIGKIAQICYDYKKPLIALVGNNTLREQQTKRSHINEVLSITSIAKNTEDAMFNAGIYLQKLASSIKLHD